MAQLSVVGAPSMFIAVIIVIALALIAALTGFILIQIRAGLCWRLLSLAVVLVASCWACSFYTHAKLIAQYGEHQREVRSFVWGVDQLTAQGRTNEVHQVCGDFQECFWTPNNTTNFDALVAHTLDLANEQTNTSPKPH
jgi:ABC-type transport system involved in cytochrome bd biosynthesis fused ATPase/permease subunit